MNVKFTHKEFTLMAGIVVALIIMLTLWMRPVSAEPRNTSGKLIPSISKPLTKAVVKKVVFTFQNFLK